MTAYEPIQETTAEDRERCIKEFAHFLRYSPDVIRDPHVTPPPELEAQAAARAKAHEKRARAALGQVVMIGRARYRVAAAHGEAMPYTLIGPRGVKIEVVRDYDTGRLFLMRGARRLPGSATDEDGKFAYTPDALMVEGGPAR